MTEEGKLTGTLLKPKLTGTLVDRTDAPSAGELRVFAGGTAKEEPAASPESPYKDSAGRGIEIGDKITVDRGDSEINARVVGFIPTDGKRGYGVKCSLPDGKTHEWYSNDRFDRLTSDTAIERETAKGKTSPVIEKVDSVVRPSAAGIKPALGGTLMRK